MPKRKRRMRLPNRYGSISYLGGNRRRPYAVYPPVTQYTDDGRIIRPKALGYAESYTDALEILTSYHKGLELPGSELVPKPGPTFAEIYELFQEDRDRGRSKTYAAKNAYRTAFENVPQLHNREFASLAYADLQPAIDNCPLGIVSLRNILSLFRGMYAYAEKCEIVDKDASKHVRVRRETDVEHGVPLTDAEIASLWQHKANPAVQMVLVMIYSGFRVSAYKSLKTVLEPDWYFQGGVKTPAGKGRIVPIHSAIREFIPDVVLDPNSILHRTHTTIGKHLNQALKTAGITTEHTAHDMRHTFSYLCEKYEVPENDRKRLMGHAFRDVTNSVYGHRSLEDLRKSIELIKVDDVL